MLDFVNIVTTETKSGMVVYPDFLVVKSSDLMTRGGKFYAVWDESAGLWSTDDLTIRRLVDKEVNDACDNLRKVLGDNVKITPVLLKSNKTKKWAEWKAYVSNLSDNYKQLDRKIIFANTKTKKEDYASKKLPYDICEGECPAYEKIISTIYDPEEREKIEWAIGAIISGDSKRIQKFFVLYGDKGTGKSTILNIIEVLFSGYCKSFKAKELGLSNASFALEPFRDNPLVAIEHDADLSRIEDNTRLNSIVSHEPMLVNEKFKSQYTSRFDSMLLLGSNKPVKITDAKSGLLRRIIDIVPSGRLLPEDEYYVLADKDTGTFRFELGAIANHCLEVYKKLGFSYYSKYKPRNMMSETNEFYNFIIDEYDFFEENKDFMLLKTAWKRYKDYCDDSNIRYPLTRMPFKNELKNYYETFIEKTNGQSNVFRGFKNLYSEPVRIKSKDMGWIKFDCSESLFDKRFADCIAQGCKDDGSPKQYWKNVKTRLCDINTHEEHWVKPPITIVCVDFDLKDSKGEKSLDLNLKAANKWAPTYAELSRSEKAIHLYYYYTGNPGNLGTLYAPNIEIKTFPGNASLRRKVTKCNDIPIATISSGLPLKGEYKGDSVVTWEGLRDEKHLISTIAKALAKKTSHKDTSSNINLIKKALDEAYESGMTYSIPQEMIDDIIAFAGNSTHQSERCKNVVGQMHFKSKDIGDPVRDEEKKVKDDRIVFFDVEIYRPDKETDNPGLFLICWKFEGVDDVNVMINPKPHEVSFLIENYKLAGFNNRGYDNMMIYAASIGYSNAQLYDLSQRIIVGRERVFPEAVNLSFIDIFDMATEKMSLKKWEIKLDKTHMEMGIPWDEPAPINRWQDIVEYCKNDVRATEAVYVARRGDFMARKIQVDIAYLLHPDEGFSVCVNDTTNTLSKRIIFGRERKPQSEFNWRDMSKPVGSDEYGYYSERFGPDYRFRVFDSEGLPRYRDYVPGEVLPIGWSILPFFPGYECKRNDAGKLVSTYLGETIGEGGRVYSVPGYYEWVWDGDISSQHPHSIIAECQFGPYYTKIFEDIVKARVAVKHRDFETAGSLLGGALKPYLSEEYAADLAQALKIVINSIYGLTSAKFENEFRDVRNFDNITAKRGALFMTLLKRELERRGAFVCHIKTDSIKIPIASDDVKDFVIKFGREFGYEFETEYVFAKFALFNDAAYVGFTEEGEWVTKADQFKEEKQPFLFKTLFSHAPYKFKDFCETKSVTEGALYLDMNEDLEEGIHNYEFVGRVGQFTPIKPGAGGGILNVKRGDGYVNATGSKGYRWLESEHVKAYGMEDAIDMSYYRNKVDKARETIDKVVLKSTDGKLGVDYFISKEIPMRRELEFFGDSFMNIPEGNFETVPFDADCVVKGDTV